MKIRTLRLLPHLLTVLVALQPLAWASPEHLLLFGGGTRPSEGIARFVEWAGGSDAAVLIITWGSRIPETYLASLTRDLKLAGSRQIMASISAPTSESEKTAFLDQLKSARGVFFSGGDQTRIMEGLKDERLKSALVRAYSNRTAFAGTSAGMAIMSSTMLTGDHSPLAEGLGLLSAVLVDSHFLRRGRGGRLLRALAGKPELLGIGVDEGATFAIEAGRYAQVLGPEQVMIMDAHASAGGPTQELLSKESCFDLLLRTRMAHCELRR